MICHLIEMSTNGALKVNEKKEKKSSLVDFPCGVIVDNAITDKHLMPNDNYFPASHSFVS